LEWPGSPHAVGQGLLDWSVEDDGIGLADTAAWQRGNGLAGVKERVWAAAGDLQCEAVGAAGDPRPGLRLRARLPWSVLASPAGPSDA
jgi:two-component system sensor histidine kinase UhpB